MRIISTVVCMSLVVSLQASDKTVTKIDQTKDTYAITLHVSFSNGDKLDVTHCPTCNELPFYGNYTEKTYGASDLAFVQAKQFWEKYNAIYEKTAQNKQQETQQSMPCSEKQQPVTQRSNRCCSLQ